ncbi:bifunctional nicotinamidase/pyrazinamidase [Aureibaculum marinum]|uniref:nicotinamidase n=1 Tax=Aureibaculum marinum TaxID=2487930 RepID=A0A3N4NU37_9FLAO|nr:bifunctional nicotinamidase/pyrazinamidase [Aureibaculum marinum]RPD99902.1 bifunctional nicotinamidase/pyrazinamidase [Aureibaculum marinum]
MQALLIIDVQPDFMPKGNLPVPDGDTIVPVINQLQPYFDLVVATQDWHPKNHISFAGNHKNKKEFEVINLEGIQQTLWPIHCVQNTIGAALHPNLKSESIEAIFRKGTSITIDSYSAFYDNAHLKSTGLTGYLKDKGVTEIYFSGLAADICVYFSIIDALNEGFKCNIITEAVKPLDLEVYKKQQLELLKKGVRYISIDEFLQNKMS